MTAVTIADPNRVAKAEHITCLTTTAATYSECEKSPGLLLTLDPEQRNGHSCRWPCMMESLPFYAPPTVTERQPRASRGWTCQLGDFHHELDDRSPIPGTPSMTRGSSSRSTGSASSSVIICDTCGHSSQQCLCPGPSDAECVSFQQAEKGCTGSSIRSPRLLHLRPSVAFPGSNAVNLKLFPPVFFKPQIEKPINTPSTANASRPSLKRARSRSPSPSKDLANREAENQHSDHDSSSEISEDAEEGSDEDESDKDTDCSSQEGNFETLVLSILGSDLPLAAHLIPTLHRTYHTKIKENIEQKVGGWVSNVTCSTTMENTSRGQSPDMSSGERTSNPHKRQRLLNGGRRYAEKEDCDEDEDDENRGSRSAGAIGETTNAQEPRLACPFHKYNPTKYAVQHTTLDAFKSDTYRSCEGPGFKSIQRLKEHLKRKHYPVQCDRCYEIFPGSDRSVCALALESHRQLSTSCERRDPALKEGISDVQWVKLDKKKSAKKHQASSRIDKYWEIWDILFPGVSRPLTPWYDAQVAKQQRASLPQDETRRFSALFEKILAVKVAQHDIIFQEGMEDVMKQRVVALAERAFDVHLRFNAHSSPPGSGSAQNSALLGGSYEQISTPSMSTGQYSSLSRHSSRSNTQSYVPHRQIYPPDLPGISPANHIFASAMNPISEMGPPLELQSFGQGYSLDPISYTQFGGYGTSVHATGNPFEDGSNSNVSDFFSTSLL